MKLQQQMGVHWRHLSPDVSLQHGTPRRKVFYSWAWGCHADINETQWYFIVSTVTVKVSRLYTTETIRNIPRELLASSVSQADTQHLIFKT